MKKNTNQKHFALCIDNTAFKASLVPGKVYRILKDARASKDDLVRIVDESGEDYIYPASWFIAVELPSAARESFLEAA